MLEPLRVGDRIRSRLPHRVVIEIVGARPTGYTWRFLAMPDRFYQSEDGFDPLFASRAPQGEWEIL